MLKTTIIKMSSLILRTRIRKTNRMLCLQKWLRFVKRKDIEKEYELEEMMLEGEEEGVRGDRERGRTEERKKSSRQ